MTDYSAPTRPLLPKNPLLSRNSRRISSVNKPFIRRKTLEQVSFIWGWQFHGLLVITASTNTTEHYSLQLQLLKFAKAVIKDINFPNFCHESDYRSSILIRLSNLISRLSPCLIADLMIWSFKSQSNALMMPKKHDFK